MIDNSVKGRVGGYRDTGIGLEASRTVDVDLNSGAVQGIVCRGRGTVEDEDGEVAEEGIGSVVESDVLGGKGEFFGNADHDGGGGSRQRSQRWVGDRSARQIRGPASYFGFSGVERGFDAESGLPEGRRIIQGRTILAAQREAALLCGSVEVGET